MVKILALASLTVDIINNHKAPGGPALYFFLAAQFLGAKLFCVGIKPKEYNWFRPQGFFVEDVGPLFKHIYRGDTRSSWILAEPTTKDYYVDLSVVGQVDGVLVSPVYKDIPLRLIKEAYEIGNFVAIDVSGFIRSSRNSKIAHRKLGSKQRAIIEKADFIHLAQEEISASGLLRAKNATILTLGKKGCVAITSLNNYYVPAYPVKGDATGAGDFFFFVFLFEWIKTRDLLRACVKASASTSLLVEGLIRKMYLSEYSRNIKDINIKDIEETLLIRERTIESGIRRLGGFDGHI